VTFPLSNLGRSKQATRLRYDSHRDVGHVAEDRASQLLIVRHSLESILLYLLLSSRVISFSRY